MTEEKHTPEDLPTAVTKSEFHAPLLVDDELARSLMARGASDLFSQSVLRFVMMMLFVGPVAFFAGITDLPFFPMVIVVFILSYLAGAILSSRVQSSLENRQYALTAKRLPLSMFWNTVWFPITFSPYFQTAQAFMRLLLVEGRFVELEAVTRYTWGMHQRRSFSNTDIPKDWGLANNLAVAYLSQWRFEEAATIFRDLLKRPGAMRGRLILLNNLALCLVRNDELDEAEKLLTEAFTLSKSSFQPVVGWRLHFVKALLDTKKGNLDSAEEAIEKAETMARKNRDAAEAQAHLDSALANIRFKQNRFDEAELYYKNALDALQAATNPSYRVMSVYSKDYAEVLSAQNKQEEANKMLSRSQAYEDMDLQNELTAVEAIKERLRSPKPLLLATDLLQLSPRERYLEMIDD